MTTKFDRWVVYYSDKAPIPAFQPYGLVVLDSRYHPPLPPLRLPGKKIIGYLSLGEAAEDYNYFADLDREGALIRPSPVWKGNRYIDLRKKSWHDRVCTQLIPGILAKGFDGIFFDTLDSPLHLETEANSTFPGMAAAAAELLSRIRKQFPKITLVMNRAYPLLDVVGASVDIVVGESVFATYDFNRKEYVLVEPALYRHQVDLLRAAVRRRPALKVCTLDYWNAGDPQGIAKIYREQRANGFCPYVATIDLTAIVREPGL